MVEHLAYNEKVSGSNPLIPKNNYFIKCEIEQSVACRAHNPEVIGSNPIFAILCLHSF